MVFDLIISSGVVGGTYTIRVLSPLLLNSLLLLSFISRRKFFIFSFNNTYKTSFKLKPQSVGIKCNISRVDFDVFSQMKKL